MGLGALANGFSEMSRIEKAVVVVAFAAAIGLGFYEQSRISALQARLRAIRAEDETFLVRAARISAELQESKRSVAHLQAASQLPRAESGELFRMRAELSELRGDAAEWAKLKGSNETGAVFWEAAEWRQRVALLRDRFAHTPGASIPELQLVTDRDWLDAAKSPLDSEAEFRRSMSTLRASGESKAAEILQKALGKFVRANNGQSPSNMAQLNPFLEPPLDPAILDRWDILPKEKQMGGDIVISQKAPVDVVFDSRFGIGPNGFGMTDFFSGAAGKTLAPVYAAFKQANGGANPDNPSELLGYAQTPEQESLVKDLIVKASVK